jgi:hypothetical protein
MLGEAYVVVRATMNRLTGDLQGAGNQIKETLARTLGQFSLSGIGTGAMQMGAGFAAAAAPLAIAQTALNTLSAEWNSNVAQGIRLSEELRQTQLKLAAMFDISGGAVRLSREQLQQHAEALDEAAASNLAMITESQARLMTFRNVQGETFKRATALALDWSKAMGISMPAAVTVLGRALNDPERGMTMLRRAGVQLSESQEQLVKNFVATGDAVKAQGVLLDALDRKYGGFAAKSVTEIERLREIHEDLVMKIGDAARRSEPITLRAKIGFAGFQEGFMSEIAGAFEQLNKILPDSMKPTGASIGQTTGQTMARQVALGFHGGIASMATSMTLDALGLRPKMPQAAQKPTAAEGLDIERKRERDKVEGFFAPLELSRKIQEQMLSKDDQIIALSGKANSLLEQIANNTASGNGQAVELATP